MCRNPKNCCVFGCGRHRGLCLLLFFHNLGAKDDHKRTPNRLRHSSALRTGCISNDEKPLHMKRPRTTSDTIRRFASVMRHFRPAMRKQRRLVVGSLFAVFLGVGLRLLEPWPLKFVLDRVISTEEPAAGVAAAWLYQLDTSTLMIVLAAAVVAITGLRSFVDYYRQVGFALIGNRVLTQVRSDLFRQLQVLPLSFHHRAKHGDLVVRVTSDINMLKDVAVSAVLPLLASSLILVGMFGVMLCLNWQLTMLALSMLPLCWLTTANLGRRVHEAARVQRRREGAMAATASESIAAIKVVRSLSLEDNFQNDFSSRNQKSLKEGVKTSRLSAQLERTVDLLAAIATALVLWQGTRLVLRNALTPGDLVVFLAYLKRGFRPLQDFAKYSARLAKATAAGERVVQLLDSAPEIRDGTVPATQLRGEVNFRHVAFSYEPGKPVFRDLQFCVPSGSRVALVGPSGIGKSTVVGLLLRLYDPQGGAIEIDGRDIRQYTLRTLRARMSVVLQDTVLFAGDVWTNIANGGPDTTREQIVAAARLANAHSFIEALPDGYDTILGERGVNLSHGQRQRLAIARAAIRQSPILLLDEPTTGLDAENTRDIRKSLERLSAGRTTFWVTHDLRHASTCDLILFIQDGTVAEQGTHDELLQQDGSYAHLFHCQESPMQPV